MLNQKIGLAVLLAGVAASDAMAQGSLNSYNEGDVLLCFRKAGAFDLVVDAGPISTFTSLSANQRYTVPGYSPSQFESASGNTMGTNNVFWSAFTYTGASGNETLYMSRARSAANLTTQVTPWNGATGVSQHNVALRIATIPIGAAVNFGAGLNDSASTSSAVIEEDSSAGNKNYPSGLSYHDALFGNFGSATWDGYFQSTPENKTTATFTTGGAVERSDFFRLTPGAASGTELGYFEYNTNGVMTYVAYPSTPAVLSSVTAAGTAHTITYSTGAYGTYSLRYSTVLTAPLSTWTVLQTLPNNANNATVIDTTTDATRFYIITAQ